MDPKQRSSKLNGAGSLSVTNFSDRKKVALKPGRSLMDWIRFMNSGKDLSSTGGVVKPVTVEELQKHNTKNDAWICLKGRVYNITPYLEFHPGGESELMRGAGRDATDLFNQIHKWVNAESMLKKCFVGYLKSSSWLQPELNRVVSRNSSVYHSCTLLRKLPVNYNTVLFYFRLPSGTTMHIPVGHHIRIKAISNGTEVIRSYTPIVPSLFLPATDSSLSQGDYIYLMIKIYKDGALTPILNGYNVGENVLISDHGGTFSVEKLCKCSLLIMLAAGTGLTPMIKLIHYFCQSNHEIKMLLIFFNKTARDILWNEEMEKLSVQDKRFSVCHVLSEPDDDWHGETGIVSRQLLQKLLPSNTNKIETFICVCGPQQFTKAALRCLEEMDYSCENIYAFLG